MIWTQFGKEIEVRKALDLSQGAEDTFPKRVYLLKAEMDQAMLAPHLLVEKMNRVHSPGNKIQPLQFRIVGPVEQSIRMTNEIKIKYPSSLIRIMKVERDKKNRIGDYLSDVVRVYIKVRV